MEITFWIISWIISSIIYILLGLVWYRIFEKTWLEEINKTKEEVKFTIGDYIGTVVTALIIILVEGYVINLFYYALGYMNIGFGIMVGAIIWIGFVAAVGLVQFLYKNRSMTLFLIDYGYHLIGLLIGGLIFGIFYSI
ncbi:MAG: DUF1761 domain-containing protein [Promethearchaeota archaeon]|nr:MAG: DUF1761 domain-containing protein [Candidatus Lokiarchaeota archaeon]